MSDRSFRHISSVLKKISQDYGLDRRINEQRLLTEWPALVGDQIGRISKPERIFAGTLYLQMGNAVWRTELLFQKAAIIQRVNAALGEEVITDIKFK
jgi:predicted nucleic acid-binding Zn ribbon protein